MGAFPPLDWRVQRHARLDSTNATARGLALQGCPEGTVVLADAQTGGRGRLGRSWHSPAGRGLWVSAVLRPGLEQARLSQLTLVAAVAVARAVEACAGVSPGIKWPNDLLAGGRKLCGILCEIVDSGREGEAPAVVAGIGLNVNQEAGVFPEPLRPVATSLFLETGSRWSRRLLLGHLLAQLEELYRDWRANGFENARLEWIERSATLGRRVRLDQGPGRIEGTACGLDRDGALLVKDDAGVVHRVDSGEIHGPCSAYNKQKSKED